MEKSNGMGPAQWIDVLVKLKEANEVKKIARRRRWSQFG
jgi:hypothetical protein